MSQTLKIKLKGQRKLVVVPEVKKVKVITEDSIITADIKDFFRIGQAEQYLFVNENNEETGILATNVADVQYQNSKN